MGQANEERHDATDGKHRRNLTYLSHCFFQKIALYV